LNKFVFKIQKQIITYQHELRYLFWECTGRCTLKCLHCGSDCKVDSVHKDMPYNDFKTAIDSIPQNIRNNITVVLTGGEPLLRKDIADVGFDLRKMGFRWSMVSNAMLYDEKTHIKLLNAGIGAVTFSLDGLEQNHNWLRNSPMSGTYLQLFRFYRR